MRLIPKRETLIRVGLFSTILLLCTLTIGFVFYGVQQLQLGTQLTSNAQLSNLSHSLVRQQASLLSVLIANKAEQRILEEHLDKFCQQEFVRDATIYAANGAILAQNGERYLWRKDKVIVGQQIVEPLLTEKGVEGYLRVTFDVEHLAPKRAQYTKFHQLYAQVMIAFLCGAVVASSLHFLLRRYSQTNSNLSYRSAKLVDREKKASQRFYSRRRRFKSH